MSIAKFSIHDSVGIKNYFDDQGYVVLENVVNSLSIEGVLFAYEEIKRNPFFVYYSQSVHLPLKPELTNEGFIKESMEDPAKLRFFPKFSGAIMDCLIDKNISTILSTLSGSMGHTIKQSMFFDLSTGTIEHQDHWYLDSDPPGQMIAVWYALEDIHEDAGCFFVLPGSHKGQAIKKSGEFGCAEHDDFVNAIKKTVEEQQYEYRSFPLKKGDALFWHPYLIHGAYSNKDPQHSRKSLTAHFQPSHLEHLYRGKLPSRRTPNPDIQMSGLTGGYLWNAKLYLDYFMNKLTRTTDAVMDMRRKNYSS